MEKKDIIGIGILSLITLIMLGVLFGFDFEKTGLAPGDFECGDGYCEDNETLENCPDDCSSICGNDIIEENVDLEGIIINESCDVSNLDGKICEDFGFIGGTLECLNCDYIFDLCINDSCGDGACEGNETIETCSQDCGCEENSTIEYGSDVGECEVGEKICVNGVWEIRLPALEPLNEICDSYDNDCDSFVDEGFDWNNNSEIDDEEMFDYDEDGYFPNVTVYYNLTCSGYDNYDCNDEKKDINPGEEEQINEIDDDCDGKIDENLTAEYLNTSIERIELGILKKDGSKVYLRERDWAVFKLNDIYGKVEVMSLTDSKVSLIISVISKSIITSLKEVEILIGETKTFNLDNKGKEDISIKLDKIQNNFKAFLTIKDISELLAPPICNNDGLCDGGETNANCPNDCLAVIYCNNNGFCDNEETIETCASDCVVTSESSEQIVSSKPSSVEWTCNNNRVCEAWESEENCPNDCKKNVFKYLKEILVGVGAILLLITFTFGTVVVNNKINPYHLKKDLKKNLKGFVDKGYNIRGINTYLTRQKMKQKKIKNALRFSNDFVILKKASVIYLSQGYNEKQIKKLCLNNKWSKKIVNEVFDDIKLQQSHLLDPNRKIVGGFNHIRSKLDKFN